MEPSLQARYAPENRCFGCGRANPRGLRIESRPEGDEVVCRWTAEPHHEAWEGTVNGGICATLLDCHSNWTAAWHLLQRRGGDVLPSTVTAELHVRLLQPTPSRRPIAIRARVVEASDRKAVVEARIEADGQVTATCRGVFVSVEPGHPAWHRW